MNISKGAEYHFTWDLINLTTQTHTHERENILKRNGSKETLKMGRRVTDNNTSEDKILFNQINIKRVKESSEQVTLN